MTQQVPDEADEERTARIRMLNDEVRTCPEGLLHLVLGRQLFITRGIARRGDDFLNEAFAAVQRFSEFNEDNDPYHKHQMAFLTVDGVEIYWKIDYFDTEREHASSDPANPECTLRVLTIALAEEY